MKQLRITFFIFGFIFLIVNGCSSSQLLNYQSETLKITPLTSHTFIHTSYLNTNSFGKVPCNGLVYVNDGKALICDTPIDNESSEELINWVENTLHAEITAVVVNHFHVDCLGGLQIFHQKNIKSYSTYLTQELAKKDTLNHPVIPQIGFDKELILKVGNEKVINEYFGGGHTFDNIVSYVPSEKVLFGGCLIKELNAGKGNLEDANVKDWPQTVKKVKTAFPHAKYVIPGHGTYGDQSLLDYTIQLFNK